MPSSTTTARTFYVKLGFQVTGRTEGPRPYASLRLGDVRRGCCQDEPVDPALRALPVGTEIVIEVDDIRSSRDAMIAAGLVLDEDLVERPWGLTDFRVSEPDGYYLRFTSRR